MSGTGNGDGRAFPHGSTVEEANWWLGDVTVMAILAGLAVGVVVVVLALAP